MRQWRLVLLLGGELAVLIALAGMGDLRRHVPLFIWLFVAAALLYFPAALAAQQIRLPFAAVLIIALQLRIPMFLMQPTLSDDVWRYIHDGRAQNAGVNPYLYAPEDPRTAQFRAPEYRQINHPHLPTIYPPVAQYAFRIAASTGASILTWRLLLLTAELMILVAVALLLKRRGLPAANLALYAWHPLAIIEGIGNAHLEPIGIAFLIAAALWLNARSGMRSAAALAASVAAKLVAAPLMLLAARNTRMVLVFGGVLVAAYLPFLFDGANVLGSLATFGETWASNGSLHRLFVPVLGERGYRLAAAAAMLLVLGILKVKRVEFGNAAFVYFLSLFLLSPVVHPWYLLWLLAFMPLRERPLDAIGCAALFWTVNVVLSYSAQQQVLATGDWQIPGTMLLLEYLPVYLLIIAATALPFSRMKLIAITKKNTAKI